MTVKVYVPAVVAWVPGGPEDPDEPPPHESSSDSAAIAIVAVIWRNSIGRLPDRNDRGNTKMAPKVANAQPCHDFGESATAMLDLEVVTDTAKVDALLALIDTVPGVEHTAFAGAPVHCSTAVPLIPAPPMLTV